MTNHSYTTRISVLFLLCIAAVIGQMQGSINTAHGQTAPIFLVQLTSGANVEQFSSDYDLSILETVPALSIYKLQANSTVYFPSLSADPRVKRVEEEIMSSVFEARHQTLYAGSSEAQMLQRYIGFGSEDDTDDSGINPVPAPANGSKKYVEQILIDGHQVKLDDKMQRWALTAVKLDKALKKSTGAGVTVAVLDTGVDLDHPQLMPHLIPGYDFVDQDALPDDQSDGEDEDEDGQFDEGVGHGTHVSGIIAMIAPEARILPVRVLNSDGAGTRFDIIQGTVFAVDHGAQVINFSLSAAEDSELLAAAIEYAVSHDVVVIAAATGDEWHLEYPAAYPNVISVGSVRKDHRFSNFSQSFASWLDVAAPGELIYSTYVNGQYAWWSGSSMAAPFVSGGAALMREGGNCNADCVSQIITSEVEAIRDRNRYGASCGGLNLEKALNKALKILPVTGLPESSALSCKNGKPEQLVFEYTGDNCATGTNSQGNKFKCSGNPDTETVSIVVTKDTNKFTVTPSTVTKGDMITISSTEAKALKNLKLNVGSQSMELSTACDVPLNVGDSFGSLLLLDYVPEGLTGRSTFVDESASTTYLPLISR